MESNQQRAELQPAALPFELRKHWCPEKESNFQIPVSKTGAYTNSAIQAYLHSESRTHKSSGLSRLHIPILLCGVLLVTRKGYEIRAGAGLEPAIVGLFTRRRRPDAFFLL